MNSNLVQGYIKAYTWNSCKDKVRRLNEALPARIERTLSRILALYKVRHDIVAFEADMQG